MIRAACIHGFSASVVVIASASASARGSQGRGAEGDIEAEIAQP